MSELRVSVCAGWLNLILYTGSDVILISLRVNELRESASALLLSASAFAPRGRICFRDPYFKVGTRTSTTTRFISGPSHPASQQQRLPTTGYSRVDLQTSRTGLVTGLCGVM